ncbi:hypothetical protein SELMODRAFT_405878 [Selaginella moellendorffii]|uniref:SWIRM domain-containing protein n=1 Tax=Selaginella moellendorffii TaxID=88036 RepID=D8QZZ1_SELML|nr:lysine-specific histone demethylase 1 homolog 3 [Selaginella moellendorffii]EFJ34490.1 hypothetical protein SELMODRAFT_405878 [Selaginella moellendorffii]|eukprot:XP_002964157.1 lysine-specific histone demethylase 1 homolog 3 [Selaginella moellendorffii]
MMEEHECACGESVAAASLDEAGDDAAPALESISEGKVMEQRLSSATVVFEGKVETRMDGDVVVAASDSVKSEEGSDGRQPDEVKLEELEESVLPVLKATQPLREYKKRKRDVSGELDFEVLMGSADKMPAQQECEAFPAVSVGLKPDQLSSTERVRFKEVVKRKTKVAEYLECRNFILQLWTKDVRRHLTVADCGVSEVAQLNEPPRAGLVRNIHEFLDYHGYINTGIVKRVKFEEQQGEEFREGTGDEPLGFIHKVQENGHIPASDATTPMDIDGSADVSSDREKGHDRKRIIVVGGGPAGLVAARHMQRMNFDVMILEARDRVGGRVYTDRSTFSVPVDLGASIITGVEADAERRADPSALICRQLGLGLTSVRGDCPLYDSVTGRKVPADIDAALEDKLNTLLDDTITIVAQNSDAALRMSLEEGLEQALSKRKGLHIPKSTVLDQSQVTVADVTQAKITELASSAPDPSTENGVLHQQDGLSCSLELERRIMDWHFANLEYGCAAQLDKVSLAYWNQDDTYGGFAGPHCMIKGGYGTLVEALAQGLDVKLGRVVTEVSYTAKDVHIKTGKKKQVRVKTEDGEVHMCDAVLVTVPLGCLKAQSIKFVPQLPSWKSGSISRLGFGTLNKVVLEFETVFWDENVDIFGATGEDTESRGRCFMFWNLVKTVGAPVLIALVVGKAAVDDAKSGSSFLVSHAVEILRKLYGRTKVPEPKTFKVTDWGSDQYSRGAYSYVAVGASGEDYDILGRPVEDCVFFAGEATCKEHPDTVGGAILSGLKEAVRILDILENRGDLIEEAEEMTAAQRQPDSERNEVRDMQIRIQAAEYANNKYREGNSLDGEDEPFTRADLLKDMFRNAKTTAGKLFLAKEMTGLSASSVKGFVGTKTGLSILNSWILDSMGKDGTQLLRLCLRLLLTVATDMLAVRLSGIGRTIKEKVCQHTSRDIRALAGQLVAMWCEFYRREKAMLKQFRKNVVKKEDDTAVSSAPACSSSQRDHSHGNAEQATSRHEQKNGASSSEGPIEFESGENEPLISDLEAAARARAEACQAAALAAAEAYANAEAERTALPEPPKILSFHKFAKREKVVTKDVPVDLKRRKFPEVLNRRPSDGSRRLSGLPLDLSGSCSNASSPNVVLQGEGNSQVMGEYLGPQHQEQAIDAEMVGKGTANFETFSVGDRLRDDRKRRGFPSESYEVKDRCTPDQIKKALSEYVVHLLTPLYKTRKIQKDAFKAIAKKTTMKVMERDGIRDTDVNISDYLNGKRKNKIRELVDKFVEKHLAETKQSAGSPGN